MRLIIFTAAMMFSSYAFAHPGHEHFYVADTFFSFVMAMMLIGAITAGAAFVIIKMTGQQTEEFYQ